MTWVRVDDGFPDHPKVLKVGPLGGWLQICALSYCNRYLTDGFIPRAIAHRLADFGEVGMRIHVDPDPERDEYTSAEGNIGVLIGSLVRAGLWEEVDGGFLIHDYDDYQPSRQEVLAERKKTAERVARFRARKKESNAVTNAVSNGGVTASPTRPGLDLDLGSKEPRFVVVGELSRAQEIREVYEHHKTQLDRPRSKLTQDRRRKINARLEEGYSVADLKQAVDGVLLDAERWPERLLHAGLDVILKNGAQVEKFMRLVDTTAHTEQDADLEHSRELARLMLSRNDPPKA